LGPSELGFTFHGASTINWINWIPGKNCLIGVCDPPSDITEQVHFCATQGAPPSLKGPCFAVP